VDVFLTGGTGFVGRAVRAELERQDHTIRLLIRPGSAAVRNHTLGARLRPCAVDPSSHRDLVACIRGAEAVIHLVGIISEAGDQTFERVHVDLTRGILNAARDAGATRFLHMSALGTRPAARSRYHQTKWTAEELVRASDLAWTIFRPSLILGPGNHLTEVFERIARLSPVVPVFGSGRNLVQPIEAEQVARAFTRALDPGEAVGQTYDLCGTERIAFRDLVRAILSARGRRRRLVHVPWWLARCQAAFLETSFPLLLRRPPPLNRDQLLMLEEPNMGDGAPADRAFGLTHAPIREMLAADSGP
jgi:NADH dehydrogenase